MRVAISAFFFLTLVGSAGAFDDPALVAPTGPLKPRDEREKLRLPAGFEAQLVASEPEIHKPMNLAFDDRGRLWVTESVEYPFPAPAGKKPRDAVKILEDFGPDGLARKVTTFADGLNIPIGLLPLPGAREALVYSIPQIWRLHDSSGAGRADQRSRFLGTFGFRDTHGMTSSFTWNFDGWIHACHGFANQSHVKSGDGTDLPLQSGNTYRVKPDGSRLEWYTHGQVNPFGLTLDPLGNVYSADCHSQPIYQLLRGGYYPSFGKPDDGLGYAPETTREDHGGTGIAGIVYYAANQFPKEWHETFFIGNVVTNRINHDRVTWHGSSPRAKRGPDFLVSDDPWFRPVDLKLGPDGALYVADFYNCIIGHYEVDLHHPRRDRERGRIWRIVYTGKHDGAGSKSTGSTATQLVTASARFPRQDWTTASVADLIQDLGHPNLTVRMIATNQLVARGSKDAMAAVLLAARSGDQGDSHAEPWRCCHSLWVLERWGVLDDATLADALRAGADAVRVHAQRILAERSQLTPAEHDAVLAGLRDAKPRVQRAAADALGRHPDRANVSPLLELRHVVPAEDTHLLHVVRMALRDQLLVPGVLAHLGPLSDQDLHAVADVALGVPQADGARFLRTNLDGLSQDRKLLGRFVHHIARHGEENDANLLIERLRVRGASDPAGQAALLRQIDLGIHERGGKLTDSARTWAGTLAGELLAARPESDVLLGIELVGSMHLQSQQDFLRKLATKSRAPDRLRQAAVTALGNLDATENSATLCKVLEDADASVGLRERAGNLLARVNRPEALAVLLKVFPVAPARLQNALAADLAETRSGADKLLEAVSGGKASARLLQERIVSVRLEKYSNELRGRIEQLTRGLPPADQKVQELLQRRRRGYLKAAHNPAVGKKIFEKSCAACHQIANQGARFGPQLDGIGQRGLDRLLEDTLDPSRNVDQAFRMTMLNLKNGQVVSGLMVKEEGEVLVMADQQGKEVRVTKNQVEERQVVPLSPMPGNFADQIAEGDYYHLLAFLLTQREPAKRP